MSKYVDNEYNEGEDLVLDNWYWTQVKYMECMYILVTAPPEATKLVLYSVCNDSISFDGAFVCGYDINPAKLTMSENTNYNTHIISGENPTEIPRAKIHFLADYDATVEKGSVGSGKFNTTNSYSDMTDTVTTLQMNVTAIETTKGLFEIDISNMDGTFLIAKATDDTNSSVIVDLGFKFEK